MIKTARMSITIKDEHWDIFVLDNRSFSRSFGKKTVAICNMPWSAKHPRCIFFRPTPSKETIIHELTHALLAYSDYDDKKTPDCNEEAVCRIMESSLYELVELVEAVYDGTRAKGNYV